MDIGITRSKYIHSLDRFYRNGDFSISILYKFYRYCGGDIDDEKLFSVYISRYPQIGEVVNYVISILNLYFEVNILTKDKQYIKVI